jgi:hypothetical protein
MYISGDGLIILMVGLFTVLAMFISQQNRK